MSSAEGGGPAVPEEFKYLKAANSGNASFFPLVLVRREQKQWFETSNHALFMGVIEIYYPETWYESSLRFEIPADSSGTRRGDASVLREEKVHEKVSYITRAQSRKNCFPVWATDLYGMIFFCGGETLPSLPLMSYMHRWPLENSGIWRTRRKSACIVFENNKIFMNSSKTSLKVYFVKHLLLKSNFKASKMDLKLPFCRKTPYIVESSNNYFLK